MSDITKSESSMRALPLSFADWRGGEAFDQDLGKELLSAYTVYASSFVGDRALLNTDNCDKVVSCVRCSQLSSPSSSQLGCGAGVGYFGVTRDCDVTVGANSAMALSGNVAGPIANADSRGRENLARSFQTCDSWDCGSGSCDAPKSDNSVSTYGSDKMVRGFVIGRSAPRGPNYIRNQANRLRRAVVKQCKQTTVDPNKELSDKVKRLRLQRQLMQEERKISELQVEDGKVIGQDEDLKLNKSKKNNLVANKKSSELVKNSSGADGTVEKSVHGKSEVASLSGGTSAQLPEQAYAYAIERKTGLKKKITYEEFQDDAFSDRRFYGGGGANVDRLKASNVVKVKERDYFRLTDEKGRSLTADGFYYTRQSAIAWLDKHSYLYKHNAPGKNLRLIARGAQVAISVVDNFNRLIDEFGLTNAKLGV